MYFMFIDEFKKEDGSYESKDGIYYEDAESFIGTHILGFCGCGNPDCAIEFVRGALQLIDDSQNKEQTFEEWMVEVDSYFNGEGGRYFMWYFLDNKGLTEHGGSVPGWLTSDGKELLSDLNELKQQTKQ